MVPQPRIARVHTALTAWRAYHVVYHGDRDRLLTGLVRPTVAALLDSGEITRFYFIRYGLGGPHVRLRVRAAPGRAAAVEERVAADAAAFFARCPSTRPLSDETVRRHNRELIPGDPYAGSTEDLVHPDNSVREHPAQLEVERYGGRRLLGRSLDFFTLSSVDALRFLDESGGQPAARKLPRALRLLARQAWGLAADADGFLELADYPGRFFAAGPLVRFFTVADETFERQAAAFGALLHDELTTLAVGAGCEGPSWRMSEAARSLAWSIRRLDSGSKWYVAASQLHMTANRLGLLNAEEVYLGRILWRAACGLAASDPAAWREIWEVHREQRRRRVVSLSRCAEAAMAGLRDASRDIAPEGAVSA